MVDIKFKSGVLTESERQAVASGFANHTEAASAPLFREERINWLAYDTEDKLIGVLAANLLWDWLYVAELWVAENRRREGLGRRLIEQAEHFAVSRNLVGLWLWTQSWQAADFYTRLGYAEFTRFPNFPRGHLRFGFRKQL